MASSSNSSTYFPSISFSEKGRHSLILSVLVSSCCTNHHCTHLSVINSFWGSVLSVCNQYLVCYRQTHFLQVLLYFLSLTMLWKQVINNSSRGSSQANRNRQSVPRPNNAFQQSTASVGIQQVFPIIKAALRQSTYCQNQHFFPKINTDFKQ